MQQCRKLLYLLYTHPITFQAEEALNYLKERKEFWAQQHPEKQEFPEEQEDNTPQRSTAWNAMVKKTTSRK